MMDESYVIGVDYGTDTVRSIIVDVRNGTTVGSAVHEYARWKEGLYCKAAKNQFRQHPLDYLEGLIGSVTSALAQAPAGTAQKIKGISVDTTGSTPVAVDKFGTPLSMSPEFAHDPDAMFILWKDHTALSEAELINSLAHMPGAIDYTKYCGGIYSSEWFWAKIAHVTKTNANVANKAYSWIEHCDWIPALLTGCTDILNAKRGRCSAGHKALWHHSWQGLPSEEFLVQLDPKLAGLRDRLFTETYTSDVPAGTLSPQWAAQLGLSTDVVVGVGAFDAHMGAVGAGIAEGELCKVIGTSTCDMMVAPQQHAREILVKGICGQVAGSIIPGMIGYEAGQSAFGDIYAWFRNVLLWPVNQLTIDTATLEKLRHTLLNSLADEAAKLPLSVDSPVAIDWLNGRRTPNANQNLTGAIAGLNLGSNAPAIYRSLVEATAFGARQIVECFISQGVAIKGIIALGGISHKSPFVMQILANVLNMPIKISAAEQACALGAAMFAATAAGIFSNVLSAQQTMRGAFTATYSPRAHESAIYNMLYARYCELGSFLDQSDNRNL